MTSSTSTVTHVTVGIALLLTFCGGYLDAVTWVLFEVMANTQTANVVLVGVFASQEMWTDASRHLLPILASIIGCFLALHLVDIAGHKAQRISLAAECGFIIVWLIGHKFYPNYSATAGLSLTAAIQNMTFTRVGIWTFSSVMVETNLSRFSEGIYARWTGRRPSVHQSQGTLFGAIAVSFAMGAGAGAVATRFLGLHSLIGVVILLMIAFYLCGQPPKGEEFSTKIKDDPTK